MLVLGHLGLRAYVIYENVVWNNYFAAPLDFVHTVGTV